MTAPTPVSVGGLRENYRYGIWRDRGGYGWRVWEGGGVVQEGRSRSYRKAVSRIHGYIDRDKGERK